LLLLIFVCAVATASAQPTRVPAKVTPRNVPFKRITEIPDAEWKQMARAFEREDWALAASLSANHLSELATENEKKQLAQLRYLHLFALAGKVIRANEFGSTTEAEKVRTEINLAVAKFVNKEILLPARPFAKECAKKLNVICPAAETPNMLRTTATNREGSAIHSFDYVAFDKTVDIKEFDGRNVFMGGVLLRVEFNEDKTKPWVLRVVIKDGNLRVVLA
jgi:hypothetical protein